jgi:hypothetical protein
MSTLTGRPTFATDEEALTRALARFDADAPAEQANLAELCDLLRRLCLAMTGEQKQRVGRALLEGHL